MQQNRAALATCEIDGMITGHEHRGCVQNVRVFRRGDYFKADLASFHMLLPGGSATKPGDGKVYEFQCLQPTKIGLKH